MDSDLAGLLAVRGVVDRGDLRAAAVRPGAVRWALDRGLLLRVADGAFADPVAWRTWSPARRHLALLRPALRRAGPGAVVAGSSAAAVWGLPLVGGPPARPVLLRPRSPARREHAGAARSVIGRRAWLEPDEVVVVHGIPVTTPARTFVDMSRATDGPWALAMADALRRGGASAADLRSAAARRPGLPGSRRARWAAERASPLPESPLESVARGVMLVLGLPEPDLQVWISGDAGGVTRYRADLYVPAFRTVIEADGKVKYQGRAADPSQSWRDKRRRDDFMSWGHEVERFVAADAHRPEEWGRRLLRTFDRSRTR
ncbi:MAG: hypothetical protein ACFCVG_15450, partial [Kineosporiaceae bacterium]